MSSIIEGGLAKFPVYRDEAAHLAAGEGYGVDLANQFGVAWTAPVDCVVVSGTGSDPDRADGVFHAGYVTVLSGTLNGVNYLFHFCHGQANEVRPGDQLTAGQVFGHVGYSGTCIPSGQGGSHLHFWSQRWGANGWERLTDVQGLLAEIEGDTMTEQDKVTLNRAADVIEVNMGERAKEIETDIKNAAADLPADKAAVLTDAVVRLAVLHDEVAGEGVKVRAVAVGEAVAG